MAAAWPLISSLPFPPVPGWIGLAGGVRPCWPLTSAGLCCWRLSVDIIVQCFLAGLGVLDNPVFFSWHATLGGVVGLLPLVLVAVGAFGRVPRRTLWLTAAVFALVVLQSASSTCTDMRQDRCVRLQLFTWSMHCLSSGPA